MTKMTGRERVLAALKGQPVDQMPVISVCQHATYDQMDRLGVAWPEAHFQAKEMASLAAGGYTVLGLDAVRAPYCQTHEAEAFGAVIKYAGREGVPSISVHPCQLEDEPKLPEDFLNKPRIKQLVNSISLLKEKVGDRVAVIGGIVGPFTIAANLLGVTEMLKVCFKKPGKVIPFLEVGERAGTMLAQAMVEAGADIICVEDMMTSLDMVSPKIYRELAAPYEKKQFSQISVPTIIHICGKLDAIMVDIAQTGASAISIEPVVDVKGAAAKLREAGLQVALIGGIDPVRTLFSGTPEAVAAEVDKAIEDGFDLISPGCGVAPASPTENLLAMVKRAQEHTKTFCV